MHLSYSFPHSLLLSCRVWHQVTDDESYAHIQDLVESSSAEFWAPMAQRELHWLHIHHLAWLTQTSGVQWAGWHAQTAERLLINDSWVPWSSYCDDSDSLFVRWFHGGQTNAAFNEIDRHVLRTHGDAIAFLSDPADGMCERTSLHHLALESVLVASGLTEDYSLTSGLRIAFYLPNDHRATVWIEAAKRVGVPYVAVASGPASGSRSAARISTWLRRCSTARRSTPRRWTSSASAL